MKISKSKKELAKIIHENGGWRDGAEWAAQDRIVAFFSGGKPACDKVDRIWCSNGDNGNYISSIESENRVANWHQTVLSREEYLHLYPAADADGWIEWKGGECPVAGLSVVDVKYFDVEGFVTGIALDFVWGPKTNIVYYRKTRSESEQVVQEPKPVPVPEAKPTIEQLATDYRNAKDYAERKQQEADDAKADADARLTKLVAAGKAIGLVLSVVAPEPELVITDWRDLQVGDVIELTGSVNPCWKEHSGSEMTVKEVFRDQGDNDDQVELIGESGCWSIGGNTTWLFIRRP